MHGHPSEQEGEEDDGMEVHIIIHNHTQLHCNISINSFTTRISIKLASPPGQNKNEFLSLSNYLHFWRSSFVAYQQQVALIFDKHFLLEASPLRWLLLDVFPRQVPVNQRWLSRAQRSHDS